MRQWSSNTRKVLAIAALAALGMGAGCVEQIDVDSEAALLRAPSRGALRADMQYMRGLALAQARASGHDGSQVVRIDLRDERQMRFVRNRLAAAEINELTAPALFQKLEEQSATQIGIAAAPSQCDAFNLTKHLSMTSFMSFVRGSCVGGAQYSMIDLYHWDHETQDFIDSTLVEEWNNGVATDIELETPAPAELFADSLVYKETADGTVESFYVRTRVMSPDPNNSPSALGGDDVGVLGPRDNMNMTAPKQYNTGDITLCLERNTQSADCDYLHRASGSCSGNHICGNKGSTYDLFPIWSASWQDGTTGNYDNDKLYMPLEGTGRTKVATSYQMKEAKAWLTLRAPGDVTPPGGVCEVNMALTTSDLSGAAPNYIDWETDDNNNRKTVRIRPFAPDFGDGTWQSHCIDNRAKVDLHVQVIAQHPSTNKTQVYVWDSTDSTALSIYWGCLPPSTQVTMADGSSKAIEDIEIGDQVIVDGQGTPLTVVDVVEGNEEKPLVVIETDSGRTIELTQTHAVPTKGLQFVQARSLKAGDRIFTSDGESTITSVTKKDYAGPVYNLVLGTDEERASRSDLGTTLYAGGVMVGDGRMQGLAKQQHDQAVAQEMSNRPIPADHYVDYVFSQLRTALRD